MEFLLAISIRSLALAAGALIVTAIVRSASARHAVWTLVTAGMLAIAIASATLPPIPVPVLRPAPPPPAVRMPLTPPAPFVPLPPPSRPFPWTAIYAAGAIVATFRLAAGYWFARRLLRAAVRIERFPDRVYESSAIAVPLTIARTIVLPAEWRTWDAAKLDAVLVHERTHVRRHDWTIAALAAVNRCVFWFHPLAWWLDAHLRALAEQACDDAALAEIPRETYAQTLVDMAAAVRNSKHRVAWEAMAMAKGAEVRMRIERILDDARPLARPITRARWTTMAIAALPVIFAAALARPAHILAQQAQTAPPPPVQTEPAPDPAPQSVRQAKRPRAAQPDPVDTSQLRNANETLVRLLQDKAALGAQVAKYNEQLAYYRSSGSAAPTKLAQLDQRIQDAQSAIEAMLQMYTERAPQVLRARATLAALEKQRELEADLRLNYADGPNAKIIKDLEASLGVLHRQIQGIDANIELQQQRIQDLNQLLAELSAVSGPTAGPRLITRHDCEYTPEARQAGIQGKVELSITVGADNVLRDVQVVHGLNPGLDQKAIDCVLTWRFRPATYQGKPVAAVILVEVPFRLP